MSARRRSSKFIVDETKNSIKKKTFNEENFFKKMNANLKIKPV